MDLEVALSQMGRRSWTQITDVITQFVVGVPVFVHQSEPVEDLKAHLALVGLLKYIPRVASDFCICYWRRRKDF